MTLEEAPRNPMNLPCFLLSLALSTILTSPLGCGSDTQESSDESGSSDSDSDSDGDSDGDSDSDSDGDGDSDTDSDGDSDADSDGDSDADSDGDSDADSDGDSDADTDGDSDADTDGDSDTDADGDSDSDGDGACAFECMARFLCTSQGGTAVEGSCESINQACCQGAVGDGDTDSDADTDSDTDGDTDADRDSDLEVDTDTSDDALFDIQSELSSEIGSVGMVTWSITEEITDAVIRFGPADGDFVYTAPVDIHEPDYRTLLLGMKPGATYKFVIEAEGPGGAYTSETQEMATDPQPNGWPSATLNGDGATWEGFTIFCKYAGQGAQMMVLDADGDLVWWYRADGGADCTRTRMSYDGKHMYASNGNVMGAPSSGTLVRVSMDGLEEKSYDVPRRHHDFTTLPDGTVTLIQYDASQSCDDIVELDPETGATATIANISDFIDTNNCHSNAINYEIATDSYTVNLRDASSVVHFTRGGEHLWTVGKTDPTISGVSWNVSHGHQLLEDGHLMVFNNNGYSGGGSNNSSVALEIAIDEAAGNATYVWDYISGNATMTLGDAKRLPNGNTLVTYSNNGIIHEVDEAKNVLQEIRFNNTQIGYTIRRPSLYGPPPDYLY